MYQHLTRGGKTAFDIRSATIKLAHALPQLRQHLIPLLRVAADVYILTVRFSEGDRNTEYILAKAVGREEDGTETDFNGRVMFWYGSKIWCARAATRVNKLKGKIWGLKVSVDSRRDVEGE